MVKTQEDFVKKSAFIPGALKQLPFHDYDVIFCLSRGVSHNFQLEGRQKALIYFFEWDELFLNQSWGMASLFKSYVKEFRGTLKQENKVFCFSSSYLKERIGLEGHIISPFFDTSKYPLKEQEQDYYYLNSNGLSSKGLFASESFSRSWTYALYL